MMPGKDARDNSALFAVSLRSSRPISHSRMDAKNAKERGDRKVEETHIVTVAFLLNKSLSTFFAAW
jgi:hypothetical protein